MNKSSNSNLLTDGYYDGFDQIASSFFGDKENIENATERIRLLKSTKENNSTIYNR